MRRWLALTCAVFAVAMPGTARAREVPLVIRAADGTPLSATLSLPDGPGPFPAAVIVSGFGPDRRDGRFLGGVYRMWSRALVANGVAVLRYDKRGIGDSGGSALAWLNAPVLQRDIAPVARALARRREVDPSRVALIGHSQGGDLVLAETPKVPFVRRVVTLAAPGRPLAALAPSGGIRVVRRLAGSAAANALIRANPIRDAARVRQPVLVVHGTADRVVPVGDAARIVGARRRAGRATELVRVPGLGHQLLDARGRVPPALARRVARFVAARRQ
ncbi:MAG: alpha/beta fold hydrolase [Actinobacteria bacterium]|nr:alpha/beta fold hydrolase [Actinomycetota bacterium]